MIKKTKDGNIVFTLGKEVCVVLAAFLFLLWRPCLISSASSLYQTAYYPAPYGGYSRLFVTQNAYMAYESGNVNWGSNGSYLSPSYGGSIVLQGDNSGIFLNTASGQVSITKGNDSGVANISIGGGDVVLTGTLREQCYYQEYTDPGRGKSEKKTYCGGSLSASRDYIVLVSVFENREMLNFDGGQDANHTFDDGSGNVTIDDPPTDYDLPGFMSFVSITKTTGFPTTGKMLCCRASITPHSGV